MLTLTGCLETTTETKEPEESSYAASDGLSPNKINMVDEKYVQEGTVAWASKIDAQTKEVNDNSKIDVSKYIDAFKKENNTILDGFKDGTKSSQIKLCLAKGETISLITEGIHSLEFLGKILAIFFVFLTIFDLFIKNHSRSENGVLTGILSALAYTFIAIFLIKLDLVAEWWQTDIVDVFIATCKVGDGTEGLILSLILGQFVYLILFLARVFGSTIIIVSIFKMSSTPQGGENNIGKAFLWFLGGLMLAMMPYILNWAGIFEN
jgi:hypothetical protein